MAKERLQIVTLLRPFGATEGQAETALQRAARRLWGVAKQNQPAAPQIGYDFVAKAPPLRFVGVLSRRERSILAESSLVVHCL